jgi:GTP-binding protein
MAPASYRDLPVVAIVGRPNVGKSTLFNRIVRGRLAIVDDEPGVTRDRNYKETEWGGKRFFVVDTGGLVPSSKDRIESLVGRQVETALAEASMVVVVVDGIAGVTPLDREIARLVRKRSDKFLLVVNKSDAKKTHAQASDFYELGLGDFMKVSAEHGTDMGELLDAICENLPAAEAAQSEMAAIAVVGKPNVGKSSLVNRLTGSDAVIVHDQPGTTRDSIDTFVETKQGIVRLVDTAGLRRKSRTDTDLDKHASLRSISAIDRSDVVILMLDPETKVAKQDLVIGSYVERTGKGMVLAWNKWDLRQANEKPAFLSHTRARFRSAPYLPVMFLSCASGEGVKALLAKCLAVHADREVKIPTGLLNRTILAAFERKPVHGGGRGFPKIYYAAQSGTRPPAFSLFVNDPELFNDAYNRHVEKVIRSIHPFEGSPLRIRVRKSK